MASQIAAVVFLALAFLAAGTESRAATLVVTKTADTADGICDSDCSLREAVSAAASGHTVVFSPLFDEPRTITLLLGQIAITQNLTITGSGRDLFTISGNNVSRIFRITGGVSVSVSGMKLINGLASGTGDAVGGAIRQFGGSLNLSNTIISNNVAREANQPSFGAGGGVFIENGALSINSSVLDDNTAALGGAILAAFSSLNVKDSLITSNSGSAIYAGGETSIVLDRSHLIGNAGPAVTNNVGPTTIRNSTVQNNGAGILGSQSVTTVARSLISDNGNGVASSGTTYIIDSIIRNNVAGSLGDKGAGLWNNGVMPWYVTNSAIINNTAFQSGGGIYNPRAHLYLTNSTVSGNYVINGTGQNSCPGGGIHNGDANGMGTVTLTNSTVANNRAQGAAGGICNAAGGTIVARNSIIAGNIGTSAVDFSGVVSSQGNNLIGNTAGSSGWTANDLQNINPILAPLGNNGGTTWTHALLPGSPAINAGNGELARDPFDNSVLAFDQRGRGYGRFIGSSVDIGSYEANYAIGTVSIGGRALVNTLGRGVYKAYISLTDSMGNVRYTQTNPFGYYKFVDLLPGTTYTIRVLHKSYQFDSPQVVTIDQPRDNLDFVAIGH